MPGVCVDTFAIREVASKTLNSFATEPCDARDAPRISSPVWDDELFHGPSEGGRHTLGHACAERRCRQNDRAVSRISAGRAQLLGSHAEKLPQRLGIILPPDRPVGAGIR